MNTKFQIILESIARENGIAPNEVYREMQFAIDAGFNNPNPDIKKNWSCIPFAGDRPTPEDVVTALAEMLSPSCSILQ